jgi:hypothetical protein
LTDRREGSQDKRRADGQPTSRRTYVAPELVEYGTVAKLTQTGSGSVVDFIGMMRMRPCL